jgi:hypothetical protein
MLQVDLYKTNNEDRFLELYDRFDSWDAVKKKNDYLYGACQEIGLALVSGLLNRYGFTSYLQRAEKKSFNRVMDIYELVAEWQTELRVLDDAGLSHSSYFIVCEALRLIREAGNQSSKVVEFIQKVDRDEGIKDNRGRDGVQRLCEFVATKKSAGATAGWANWDAFDMEIRKSYRQWIDYRFNKTRRKIGVQVSVQPKTE